MGHCLQRDVAALLIPSLMLVHLLIFSPMDGTGINVRISICVIGDNIFFVFVLHMRCIQVMDAVSAAVFSAENVPKMRTHDALQHISYHVSCFNEIYINMTSKSKFAPCTYAHAQIICYRSFKRHHVFCLSLKRFENFKSYMSGQR